MLHVLTPTGGRPDAFAACVEMMRAQDYAGPARWIIVDDGPEAMPTPAIDGWDVLHLRPEPLWQPGQNTQARNILAGLDAVVGAARLVIVEDDDAYAPWWLRWCEDKLESHDLVGESHSIYVNRKTGNRHECKNDRHASLCSTALKGETLAVLRHVCETGDKGIDLRLWKAVEPWRTALYRPGPRGVTGIKGWPGRPGIGMGHRI